MRQLQMRGASFAIEGNSLEQIKERLARFWWVPTIALGTAAVALIIANLMGTRMADWVGAAMAAGIGVAVFFVWKWGSGKLAARIAVTGIGVVCALFCIGGVYFSPYWNSIVMGMAPVTRPHDSKLTQAESFSDLQYAMHYLSKVHPAFAEGTPEEVAESYAKAGERIADSETLTVTELAGVLQSVMEPIGDAHTGITLTYAHNAGEPHRLASAGEHAANGDVLTHVNGVSVDDLFDERRALVPAETDEYGARRFARYAMSLEGLEYLGIQIDGPITYTFVSPDGTVTEETVSPEDFINAAEYDTLYPDEGDVTKDFVSYEIDEENSLAVLRVGAWVNNAELQNALSGMFQEVKDKGIENVAVDVRNNAGGDITAVYEFLKYIYMPSYTVPGETRRYGPLSESRAAENKANTVYEELAFSGNLYALTSAETLSSAMVFAEILQDNGIGEIAGETPGARTRGYGDMVMFELPNSHLILNVSSMQMEAADTQGSGYVEPDIPSDASRAVEALRSKIQSEA